MSTNHEHPTDRDTGFVVPAARHVLALAAAVAIPSVAWSHFVANARLGLHDHGGAAGTLRHIVLDGSLAVPLVALAVLAFFVLVQPRQRRTGTVVEAALLGGMSATALAVGALAHDQIHPGLVTSGPVVHAATQFLIGLPAALLMSFLLVSTGRTRAQVDPVEAPVRRFALPGVVAAGLVATTLPLGAGAAQAQVAEAGPCPTTAPVKTFDVQSINVDIPLNRYGDHDPLGKMYVLTKDIPAVREQERTRLVTLGLGDDAIQPLSIRANVGECVVINYTNNAVGGDYGLHIDGLAYKVTSAGNWVGNNPNTLVPTGQSRTFTYWIPDDINLEGAKYMSPGPGFRSAINHGLFGTLTVEPKGSTYFSQYTGLPIESGWAALVVPGPGEGAPFRENVKMAHEIGNETETVPDGKGGKLPFIDPITEAYRPGSRAYNYRSEPFYNRLAGDHHEKSHSYSSYVFGDPATIVPQGYLGEATKFRVVHAGSEVFHVYHLHGGGIRWRLNPKADPNWNYAQTGLKKTDDASRGSARLDAQNYGPGESYNLEIEGGAGGSQQSPGDFLFHCHISEHYVAGMWGFWRVFDTSQPGLAPLPGSPVAPESVTSDQLVGRTMPDGTVLTAENLDQWIRPQLPSQGARMNDEDATVMDWTVDPATGKYLNEVEDTTPYANFDWGVPGRPGALPVDAADPPIDGRTLLRFNPVTGRPAFPMLRPHLHMRVPFSGNMHTGSPYLGETGNAAATPGTVDPWAARRDGLCPSEAQVKRFDMVQVVKALRVTRKGAVDRSGVLYTLAKDKDALLADQRPSEPLAIRMNVGDCADVSLTTETPDAAAYGGFSKTNLHVHHLQFDPSGSDGVSAGFAFEHSVRPYKTEDPQLTAPATAGSTTISVTSAAKFRPGIAIGIGLGLDAFDMRYVTAVDYAANTVTVDRPLSKTVAAGQWAGVEFVRYRWFADAQLDNVFWHDHVDGTHGWGHGAMGQIIIEPKGSTYHDPRTGAEVDSGNIVDIRTSSPLAPGLVNGSFREVVMWTLDNNPTTDSTINLKAEPFADRSGDPSLRFSSYAGGDPWTPLWRAYPGDPFVIRSVNSSVQLDTFRVQGHRFWEENGFRGTNGRPLGSPVDTVKNGVSERYTAILDGGAGGPLKQAGDYLYYNGVSRRFRQGAWGILRVLNGRTTDLQPLPVLAGTPTGGITPATPAAAATAPRPAVAGRPPAAAATSPCPAGVPLRSVAVSAVDLPAGKYAGPRTAGDIRTAYVPTASAAAVIAGTQRPEPLVIHAAEGDCLRVTLTNRRKARAGFDVSLLNRTASSNGVNVGWNAEQTVAPGRSRDFIYFVDTAKVNSALIQDPSSDKSDKEGLYGLVSVAPRGATFLNPRTGAATAFGTQVQVRVPGTPGYRSVSLFVSDDDPIIGADFMPYPVKVSKGSLVNYMSAGRPEGAYNGTPNTPVVEAYVGDPVRVNLVATPGSEQSHTMVLGDHQFARDPNLRGLDQFGQTIRGSEVTASIGTAPGWVRSFDLVGGAGGAGRTVGDLWYGDARRAFTEAGMWGVFRVRSSTTCTIRPLDGRTCLGTP